MNKPKPGTYEYNKEYAKKWAAQFVEVKIRVAPDTRDIWKRAAAARGESLNQYVLNAVQNRMDKEKEG